MDNVPLPNFRLSLLGRFELIGSGGPVHLSNKKLAGLLAYLACTAPRPQPREKLATLLWGSHFEAQARQNFRQTLFRLRRVLGQEALVGDGDEISLAPDVVDCDAARFEKLVQVGTRDALVEAVNLYQDRLLAGMNIAEEGWAEWLDLQGNDWKTRLSTPWSGWVSWSCSRVPTIGLSQLPTGRPS
jgi:DNA-binding SARP family transcriptional activator